VFRITFSPRYASSSRLIDHCNMQSGYAERGGGARCTEGLSPLTELLESQDLQNLVNGGQDEGVEAEEAGVEIEEGGEAME
jgi:hypothetical protein